MAQVRALHEGLRRLGEVLGLFASDPADWLDRQRHAALAGLGLSAGDIASQIAARLQARQDKDFARADAIRDELEARGILLLDGPAGTDWKIRL